MNQSPRDGDITIEDLLTLVEKAVGAIERLQTANATLTAQLRAQKAAAQTAATELAKTAMQIGELEHAAATLRKDAHWCRWFRSRYGGADFASFYGHIESEYRRAHPDMAATDAENHHNTGMPRSGDGGKD
ncbi:MAG TPA: hypothetical protein VGE12_04860 [Noviherbaspirillum sp.]